MRADLVLFGSKRDRRYALRRTIAEVGSSIPVFEVEEAGGVTRLATLHAVEPGGFCLEFDVPTSANDRFTDDFPSFMADLRPEGFLGRRVPRLHPELRLPEDVRLWSADHCLRWLVRYGWDAVGNLLVGEASFREYVSRSLTRADPIDRSDYPRLAGEALAMGAPGSSAGGEQPKFVAIRAPDSVPVLVKFSPPVADPVSRRIADLLVCEHLAHRTLEAHGHPACRSVVLTIGRTRFLEVERLDRAGAHGRRGVVSLRALDAEYAGRLGTWSETAEALAREGVLDRDLLPAIRWLELFGRFIGDSDMHGGNLSFHTRQARLVGLAPAYDRLPMLYAPIHGQVPGARFEAPLPAPDDVTAWKGARAAAIDFWRAAAGDRRISPGFRQVARRNEGQIQGLEDLAARL